MTIIGHERRAVAATGLTVSALGIGGGSLANTREHVPERVAIPGMIRAYWYVDGQGPLPSCPTLYDLQTIDVLTSAPSRALLETPSDWSHSMRPSFRGFLRLAYRPVARLGGGMGGAVLATTLRLPGGLNLPDAVGFLHGALAIPAVPFSIGGDMPDYPRDDMLVLDGYDRDALIAASKAVNTWLAQSPWPALARPGPATPWAIP